MPQPATKGSLTSRVLKVSSLFGGLQVVNILCSILRAKLVAIWIGPAGVGLFGLFNTALEMINSVTQLGLRQSAVRDIAVSDQKRISLVVKVVRRWAVWLGLLGALLTVALSPLLSKLSFGTTDMWHAFALLALLVFLASMNMGEGAVFQGLKRFKKLAVCSMIGAVGGLAVSIPMFYYWKIDSILPSIMAYGVVTWLAMGLYREKVAPPDHDVSLNETIKVGKSFLILGIYLTVTGFITNAVSYVFISYLNLYGATDAYSGSDAAGYFQSGFTLVTRYVGLVFTAISMEYFPRLSAVSHSSKRTSTFVSHELFIALSLLVPVVCLFITCTPIIIRLLYSAEFALIAPFVVWAAVGTIFRGVSWCMAFVIVARADGKVYLLTEVTSGLVFLILNVLFYRLWGVAGLGYAYVGWYLNYTLIIGLVYFVKYRLAITHSLVWLSIYAVVFTSATALVALNLSYWLAIPFVVVACVVALLCFLKKNGKK